MRTHTDLFDRIGGFYTSRSAVILLMTFVIAGLTTVSHTLFNEVFPTSMTGVKQLISTWGMAIAWESTVLIMTCNYKPIDPRIAMKLGIVSTIMILFFFGGFDFHHIVLNDWTTWLAMLKKWYMASLFGWMSYAYAELFYLHTQQMNQSQSLPMENKRLQSENNELRSKLNEVQSALNQLHTGINDRESLLNQYHSELVELRKFKEKTEQDLKCPYCDKPQSSADSLRVHKGRCPKKSVGVMNQVVA